MGFSEFRSRSRENTGAMAGRPANAWPVNGLRSGKARNENGPDAEDRAMLT